MSKPGVMLYFDLLEPIQILEDEDRGKLLVAILEYGQSGKEPGFKGALAMAWGFIRPRLDRDEETYQNTTTQRKYASYCKKRAALELPKIPFDTWQKMTPEERLLSLTEQAEAERAGEAADSRDPTTTTTTNTTTTANTNTTINTDTNTYTAAAANTGAGAQAAAAAEKKLKYMNGELGKGVVVLSEYQVDLLLDKLGLEMFDHYVSRLANYILKNGATVKSHYTTILKWWTEDSLA